MRFTLRMTLDNVWTYIFLCLRCIHDVYTTGSMLNANIFFTRYINWLLQVILRDTFNASPLLLEQQFFMRSYEKISRWSYQMLFVRCLGKVLVMQPVQYKLSMCLDFMCPSWWRLLFVG